MSKNSIGWGLWVIILILFVSLQVYNYIRGNYSDLLTTGLILLIPALILGVLFLLKRQKVT